MLYTNILPNDRTLTGTYTYTLNVTVVEAVTLQFLGWHINKATPHVAWCKLQDMEMNQCLRCSCTLQFITAVDLFSKLQPLYVVITFYSPHHVLRCSSSELGLQLAIVFIHQLEDYILAWSFQLCKMKKTVKNTHYNFPEPNMWSNVLSGQMSQTQWHSVYRAPHF